MTLRDHCKFEMLQRLRRFGEGHVHLLSPASPAHAALAVIAGAIEELPSLDVREYSATRATRVERKALARARLVDALIRAGATARVLAKTHPDLRARVELPLPTEDQLLLTIARSFVSMSTPFAEGFAAYEMPLAEIEREMVALQQAIEDRSRSAEHRVKARVGAALVLRRAMDAVESLDVCVANGLRSDPVVLASWAHARRIVYPWRRAAKVDPVPNATPESSTIEAREVVEQRPDSSGVRQILEFHLRRDGRAAAA